GTGPMDDTNLLSTVTYTLKMTPIPTHAQDNSIDVVFVGWSASAVTAILEASDIVTLALITDVTISGADVTVYAVWGYDTTTTGIPDVLDTQYKIEYALNGGTTGPADDMHLLSTVTYTLSATIPTHANVMHNSKSTPVVFVNWSDAPALILTKDDASVLSAMTLVTSLTIGTSDEIVYAIWGFDTTGNGVPDVSDTKHLVTYDLNGGTSGTGPMPNPETVVEQNGYTFSTTPPDHPQVNSTDVVFVGWSDTPVSQILGLNDA
ncbi:MAG: InlB B-repeat-containing protein, partial [Methanimicrococcus sp.]|nr:InlB B-repeat-containing protein [Methanimicrococcus sp.]